ncbi:helix-turn-helix domain-containing protein [Paenibacillus nasutitermitis]|uniref:AraC family transcriptional regulator n=1 Tax=Paenibacillus nasutitermitis TaxID=1652958 RepID=A0A917DYU7_9BACL|nr:AraC family transcriptional regulator [Paenibacillus nasutitermitis]GGD83032.1 AraC family transcriptional regulator [Paenibacillus nasutitermitis]
MDIPALKVQLPPIFNRLCHEITVNDTVIDWIDITFEQIGNATSCPPHSHTWFEFNYVLSGYMITSFGSVSRTIREGDFFLIPPGVVHSHIYTKGNPHEGFSFRFRLRELNGPSSGSIYPRLARLGSWRVDGYRDSSGLLDHLQYFFHDAAHGGSPLGLQLMLVQFLEKLAAVQQSDKQNIPYEAELPDQLVKKVEIYMEGVYGDQLNATALAASLHMSYGHLSRLYKRRTGMTIIERMNQIRLAKACHLLEDPQLSIKEIAAKAGFPDIYYFSKAFKRKLGVSPSIYRKQLVQSN